MGELLAHHVFEYLKNMLILLLVLSETIQIGLLSHNWRTKQSLGGCNIPRTVSQMTNHLKRTWPHSVLDTGEYLRTGLCNWIGPINASLAGKLLKVYIFTVVHFLS